MYEYRATLERVIDGDTLKLTADLGFSIWTTVTVRLARINAPELTTTAGWQARAWLLTTLQAATEIRVTTRRRERYGRWLAEVTYRTANTSTTWHNLSDEAMKHGHAKPYTESPESGGTGTTPRTG